MSTTVNISSNSASWSLPATACDKLAFVAKSTSGGQYQSGGGTRARSDSDSPGEAEGGPEYKRARIDSNGYSNDNHSFVTPQEENSLSVAENKNPGEAEGGPEYKRARIDSNGYSNENHSFVTSQEENSLSGRAVAENKNHAVVTPQAETSLSGRAVAENKALERPFLSSSTPAPEVPLHGVPKHATPDCVPPKVVRPASQISQSILPAAGSLQTDPECPQKQWPYSLSNERAELLRAARQSAVKPEHLPVPTVVHVDVKKDELSAVLNSAGVRTERELFRLVQNAPMSETEVIVEKTKTALPSRTVEDTCKYIQDYSRQKTSRKTIALVARPDADNDAEATRQEDVCPLLLMREVAGHRGYGGTRSHRSVAAASTKFYEDGLELRERWSGAAGDISTITWVSNDVFVCGTTEHSDAHNQQYNKPGNLALGSCSTGTLKAFPDHRIVRPRVTAGENARVGMRESQSPWLYTSVVSSDHDVVHQRTYTAGFDHTVKIWAVQSPQMKLLGEWVHGGNVNFVVASKHASGMVATGADVPSSAIRVYDFRDAHVSQSPFRSFSCSRTDENGNIIATDNKWAYFPATMQWGLAPEVQSFLLVGYSPRSLGHDDSDIPSEILDTGELCVWDMLSGQKWEVNSVTHKNVFEVLWHPTHSSFIAATSPKGVPAENRSIKTQIRVFSLTPNPSDHGATFTAIKVLDCNAMDINELTIKPNSPKTSYITAGCTDGNVYVWDSGLPQDTPMHVLRHGNPIDEYRGDREKEDTGVKFTAWGKSMQRLYTGSSDGMVKVWDVQSRPAVLIRNLVECPAPVSYGMFSPDMTKLLIGDATGRVALFTLDQEDDDPNKTPLIKVSAQYSKPIVHHAEPPPPPGEGDPAFPGITAASEFLQRGQLRLHKDRTIGAIQGPMYSQTELFCRHAHRERDAKLPLMAFEENHQQEIVKIHPKCVNTQTLRTVEVTQKAMEQHAANLLIEKDLPVVQSLAAGFDFDVCATNAHEFAVSYESESDDFCLGMDMKETDMQEDES